MRDSRVASTIYATNQRVRLKEDDRGLLTGYVARNNYVSALSVREGVIGTRVESYPSERYAMYVMASSVRVAQRTAAYIEHRASNERRRILNGRRKNHFFVAKT